MADHLTIKAIWKHLKSIDVSGEITAPAFARPLNPRLAGIPGVLIHGRLDLGGPPDVPWLLHQAWPHSELHLVRTGHQGGDEMTERMLAALNRFARV